MGLMYATGAGLKRNYLTAYKWFSLAFFHYPAGEYRDNAFRNRENAAAAMTAAQLEKAERLVRRWKPKTR